MVVIKSLAMVVLVAAGVAAQSGQARKRNVDRRRRSHRARRVKRELVGQLTFEEEHSHACMSSETACPTNGSGFECVDLQQTLDSCGACNWSCESAHPNAKTISCAAGACVIHACKTGFAFDTQAATCV